MSHKEGDWSYSFLRFLFAKQEGKVVTNFRFFFT